MSQKLFPKDSFVKATPVKCFGEGNCLFRAVSLYLQGDENLHLELRIRVVIEIVMNIDLYCSNEQMKTMNAKVQIPNPVDILWHTCIDKEHMKETVKESLKSQLMKWVKDGCFSSLWESMPSLTSCWNQLPHYAHKFSVSVCQGLFIMPFWSLGDSSKKFPLYS